MGTPFSCIVTKAKTVLTCKNPNMHSHEDIVIEHNLKDVFLVNRAWVRIEVYPEDNYTSNVDDWYFKVDEKDTLPEWFKLNQEFYEKKCRKAASVWQKELVDELGQYVVVDPYRYQGWYKNGKRHKLDGPAVVSYMGRETYYIEDEELSEKEFLRLTQKS